MRNIFKNISFGIYIRFPGFQGELTISNTDHNGNLTQKRVTRVNGAAHTVIYPEIRNSISFLKKQGAFLPSDCYSYRANYPFPYSRRRVLYSCLDMYGHRAYFKIDFDTPVAPAQLDKSPYDPYLRKKVSGGYYDIHLAGKEPLPGSNNPIELAESGFRDADGYPWALLVPGNWAHLEEVEYSGGRKKLPLSYPDFNAWRESRGRESTDWYLHPQGNYISNKFVKFTTKLSPPFLDGALKREIFTNIGSFGFYTGSTSVNIEGKVLNFSNIESLRYSLNDTSMPITLNNENKFTFSLQLPLTRAMTSHTLTIIAKNDFGMSYQVVNKIIYVPEIVPDQLILVFKPNISLAEKNRVIAHLEGEIIRTIRSANMVTISLPTESDVKAKEREAERFSSIESAFANLYAIPLQATTQNIPQTIPGDTHFNRQWGLHNTGQTYGIQSGNNLSGTTDTDIDAPEAWNITTGSQDVTIAILDTGVDWRHPDLIANIWQNMGEDADGDGHTIACIVGGNDTGISTSSPCVNGQWELDPGDINMVDDDNNTYTDDLIGWNFCFNNNDPSDSDPVRARGHGTHVAGIAGALATMIWESQELTGKLK